MQTIFVLESFESKDAMSYWFSKLRLFIALVLWNTFRKPDWLESTCWVKMFLHDPVVGEKS